MTFLRRRRERVGSDLERAHREREAAEERLRHAQEHVIIPLRQLREKNHVGELIDALISGRAGKSGDA